VHQVEVDIVETEILQGGIKGGLDVLRRMGVVP
jgi:hypothetical protein